MGLHVKLAIANAYEIGHFQENVKMIFSFENMGAFATLRKIG